MNILLIQTIQTIDSIAADSITAQNFPAEKVDMSTSLLLQIGYSALVIVGNILLFWIINALFRILRRRIHALKETKLKSLTYRDYELLNTDRQVKLLIFLSNVLRYIVFGLILIFTIPLLFAIFPATKGLAYTLLGYAWNPIKMILTNTISYIPNIFIIAAIWFSIRYLLKGVAYLASEIESEKLKITGFYADWAMPTYQIIRFLMYAFMIAMIYPYLPGADGKAFQGISVFVGLVISLGSSTVIGNIIAGMVITYMRAFKEGDRIKLNETVGNVIEKTIFVTRLRTVKNEVVTVPNSFILNSHSTNYSSSARQFGLIIHTEVTIGYDVPWRKVHSLLLAAAHKTDGVQADPEPFILETSLSDWYPVYQLNAYIVDADRQAGIMSEMLQNIQDEFAAADVEIMSPTYLATRDGNASTVPSTHS